MSMLSKHHSSERLTRGTKVQRRFRPRLEVLEDRTLLAVNLLHHYTGLDFAQSSDSVIPPDTNGAAGPTSYIEVVNDTIAIYTPKTTGAAAVTDSLSDFWFTQGGLLHADASSRISDVVIVWDEQIQRFIVGQQDVDFGGTSGMHVSRFDIAVSKTASPATLTSMDWKFYPIITTETGFDADYPGNFGWNHDEFVFTLNMFSTTTTHAHVLVTSIKSSDLATAAAVPHIFKKDFFDSQVTDLISLRPTVMHDSVAGDPMWFITEGISDNGVNTNIIDVVKGSFLLSAAPSFTDTLLHVTPYFDAVNSPPLQPDGTQVTPHVDSRILKAAESSHVIVATDFVSPSGGTELDARWYRINVGGATPTIADQGNVSDGNNTYISYPGIDINSSGQIGMSYLESGTAAGQFLSVNVTGRVPADPAGTMETPVLVQAGVQNYHDFGPSQSGVQRAGDLSGISVDSDGSFWIANEFADNEDPNLGADWGTAIGHFRFGTTAASADLTVNKTGPATAAPGTNITYTITLTNNGPSNAQGVSLTDAVPSGTTFVSATPVGGMNPDGFSYSQSVGTVTGLPTGGVVVAGNTDQFTLVVHVNSGDPNGSTLINTASVNSSTPDPTSADNSATVTTTVITGTSADLSVTKTGPSAAAAGTNVTYTITVTNNGPSNAQSVTLSDVVPNTETFVSQSQTGGPDFFNLSNNFNTVSDTIATLPNGHSDTFTITVTIKTTVASGTHIINTATISSSTTPDPNTANNTSSTTLTVSSAASADLAVTKTGPATASAGNQITYTITVRNNGPIDAQNVSLTDTLPAGETLVAQNQTGGPDVFSISSSGNMISDSIATLPNGHTDTFTITVVINANVLNGTQISNAAMVSSTTPDPNLNNNSSTTTMTVSTSADLAVTKTGPAAANAGSTITYTITVTNNGPSDAQNVTLSDHVPGNETFVLQNQTGGTDAFSLHSSGNIITDTVSTLPSGSSDTFTITVTINGSVPNGTQISNTATISSTTFDPNHNNNTSSTTLTVSSSSADLAVTKTGPSTITAGTNLTYTITVTNSGPNDAQNVSLTDTLPTGETLVSQSQIAGSDVFSLNSSGNMISDTIATLPNGHTDTFTITVAINANVPNGTQISNAATVSSATPDPNSANNTSTTTTTVSTSADLAVTKTGPSVAPAGSTITYVITVTNNGPSDAQSVQLSDMLPASETFVSQSQTSGTDPFSLGFNSMTNTITDTSATVPSGSSDTLTITVMIKTTVANGTQINNAATVSSTTSDPNSTNNSSTTTTTVGAAADLAVTKTGPGLAPAGSTITYVITVTNNGPSDAQAVALTDMFPSSETFVMQSQSSGPAFTLSSGGNAISDTITTLAAGASATFNVTVTIHSTVANGSQISNTAMVSSSTPDPNPNNNSSTSTTTVGTNTGLGVGPNQTRTIFWWDTPYQGQQLIRTAPPTSAGLMLGQWLASTYPNLYGGGNGAPDLSGFSNDMVAAFFDSLYHQTTRPRLEANVMAATFDVYFTTLSLGGSVGKFYGLSVNAAGVGAYNENVLSSGAAFGVANNTWLTVDQILQDANGAAVNGHPWNGNTHLQQLAFQVFALINGDQALG